MSWEWLIELVLPYINELLTETILPLLFQFLSVVLVSVGTYALNWWKNLMIEEWIKDLIIEGILYAQEKFWDEIGSTKFEYAKQYTLDEVNKRWFISISEERLNRLIYAFVKDLKNDFDDLWYNNPPRE